MKYSLTILILITCFSCFGQNDKYKCDSGYHWFPSMSTSSLIIKADTCLPDSICNKLSKIFAENMCGEIGLFVGDGYTYYSRSGYWSDECGCDWVEEWKKKVNGKWIDITEAEYNKINKVEIHSIELK